MTTNFPGRLDAFQDICRQIQRNFMGLCLAPILDRSLFGSSNI